MEISFLTSTIGLTLKHKSFIIEIMHIMYAIVVVLEYVKLITIVIQMVGVILHKHVLVVLAIQLNVLQ
jgi:hypothetical protein